MKGRQITLAPAGFTDPDARPSDSQTVLGDSRFDMSHITFQSYAGGTAVLPYWD